MKHHFFKLCEDSGSACTVNVIRLLRNIVRREVHTFFAFYTVKIHKFSAEIHVVLKLSGWRILQQI